jgi:ATP-dependent DNA helicase DinG
MSQKIFCYIPEAVLGQGETGHQIRVLLAKAIAAKVTPVALPKQIRPIAVNIEDSQIDYLKSLGHAMAPGRLVGGMLYAMHLQGNKDQPHGHRSPELSLQDLRSGQIACLQVAAPLLASGKIVMAEAGTGSGKSRIIAHAAAFALSLRDNDLAPDIAPVNGTDKDLQPALFLRAYAAKAQAVRTARLQQSPSPQARTVIICAPSIENLSHLVAEWRAVKPIIDPQAKYRTAIVLGRGQYVSASKLRLLLDELDESLPEVERWLDAGMHEHFTAATKALEEQAPGMCGMMADLAFLASDSPLNAQDAALDEDSTQDELKHHQETRAQAREADVIFTTTAMLCMDNLRLAHADDEALLPYPFALFVDEAHTLESIQASTTAKSLSLLRLMAELKSSAWEPLRKATTATQAVSIVKKLSTALELVYDQTPLPITLCSDRSSTKAWENAQPVLKELTQALTDLSTIKRANSTPALSPEQSRSLRYVALAAQTLEHMQQGWRGIILQSPKRYCTSFTIGPANVSKFLAARWETTPMGMLLSGTMAHIGPNGASFTSIRNEVAIAPDREAYTSPLHPSWIYSTPTVYTVGVESFHHFVPPSGQAPEPEQMAYWLSWCARGITHAAQDAHGGMLVLMTGYERLELLGEILKQAHPHLSDRLVIQQRNQAITRYTNAFKTMAKNGQRPIWLATGPAWTGLDLTDRDYGEENASQDLLLTDLVIPNLPFRLEKTNTHFSRVARQGFLAEIVTVQRKLRQGLGRLVRRDKLQHRRIWLLDGRLEHPAAKNYLADIHRMLGLYLHRKTFTPANSQTEL